MDRFSPVAPAAIRVHVLPVGKIERSRFQGVLNKLQRCAAIVELADLPDGSDHLLSPSKFPQGSLLLNYTTYASSEQEHQLSPYELFREPLLVLGVASGLSDHDIQRETEIKEAAGYLHERHPRIVHRHILLLEAGDRRPTSVDNVTVVAESDASDGPALRAAMCEAAARFLVEFTTFTKALQASPTVQTPGQTSRGLQRPVSLRGDERRPESGYATPTQSTAVSSPTADDNSRPPSRGFGSPPPAPSCDQVQRASNVPNALARSDSRTSNRSGQNGNRASSQDRVSVHGFGPSTSKEKDKNRGKARVGIVIGHIHMMAGQWREALRMLIEHTNVARKLSDSLWHGKGLEGILVCMLLHAWAGIEFSIPSVCFPTAERSRALHAAKLSVNLPADFRPAEVAYQAAVGRLSTSLPELLNLILSLYGSAEGSLELVPLVIYEVRVRFCELLAILHGEGGELNGSARTRIVERSATRPAAMPSVSNAPNPLSKSVVANMLAEAQPTEDDHLATADHIQILAGIGSVYSSLGMERKKGLVLKDMIDRLTVALIHARKLDAAEAGIHPAASLSTDTGVDSIIEIATESAGVTDVIDKIAEIYGIYLLPSGVADVSSRAPKVTGACQNFGNDELKDAVMQVLIAFYEASPDPQGVLRIATSLLRSATANTALDFKSREVDRSVVSKADQTSLATIVARTVGLSRHLGLSGIQAEYWDPFFLRRVDFIPPDATHTIVTRAHHGLAGHPAEQSPPGNPLLYDPNASSPGTAVQHRRLMVHNEPMTCLVTLQNPLEVAVVVEAMILVAEGKHDVELETHGFIQTTIEANCFKQVSISVSPSSIGDFTISGCRIRVAGCHDQVFPIVALPWAPKPELLLKYLGQSARDEFTPGPDAESIVVPVTSIDAMPVIELESISLADSSIMLLDGEKQELQVVVRNITTHTPARIVDIADAQSVVRLRTETLSSDLDGEDVSGPNESNTNLHNGLNMAVKKDASDIAILQPGESAMLSFDVTGKAGVSEAELIITYQRSEAADGDAYARILAVPIHMTVDVALEAQLVDVASAHDGGFMLTFDLRNAWSKPIAYCVDVWRGPHGEEPKDTTPNETLLAPGGVHRITEHFDRSSVSRAHNTLDDVKQELLRRMRVPWRTWVGDARWGEVDLGRLDFGPEHLELMRGRSYSMRLDVVDGHKAPVKPGTFITIRATMSFEAPHPGPLWVELQSALDKRKLGLVGVPHRILPPMSANEEVHVDFCLCPMMPGVLELDAFARPAVTPADIAVDEWRTERSLSVIVQ
ncbi:hypothetical protein LTR36_000247 [Oleoguttula mirabilis]|uniref:Uncharacterized protein n=1 Tax=Oleoguttula mirabilis TaxID=1507867 RepID=A0AAV9JY05_9PEZI|nr:hypothetical protein LTR36_000247 [Oleoguttula mirabilis]